MTGESTKAQDEQTAESPAVTTVAEQIREVERTRLRTLVEGDVTAASDLHAPDFQLVTPIGMVLSKVDYLTAVATGHIDYVSWEPAFIDVRVHGKSAAIRYKATLEVVFGGSAVPRATYWHTDTYENADGRWRAVWSQATEIR
ncbi:nuclear transport factor 2 family protein [Streptomyces sp. NPDC059787]|uniref:nuclear transport factor 2 family protein n=1 Tax=Streptomyces sp. NPDC059787 TaxID=3346947 RepID=UPI0036613361